jgi:hypothetical protein
MARRWLPPYAEFDLTTASDLLSVTRVGLAVLQMNAVLNQACDPRCIPGPVCFPPMPVLAVHCRDADCRSSPLLSLEIHALTLCTVDV